MSLLERRAAKKKQLSASLFKGSLAIKSFGQKTQEKNEKVISDTNNNVKPKLSMDVNKKKDFLSKNRFESRYQVLEELGQGAHAVVKKCIKSSNGKTYAVKIIRSNDEEIMIATKNCYNLQKQVQKSPHICKTYELFIDEENENIYQVMDYIPYPSIHSFANKFENRQIPPNIAKIIIRQILEAIKHMHDLGVCHRDLKPDNIMINPNNNYAIKIIDFGISRKFIYRDPNNRYNSIRHDMWSCTGTMCYKSPEMFSAASYNETCDMWSLGVITYEIMSGKLPFYQEYQSETIEQIQECRYEFDDVHNFSWKQNKSAKDFVKRILKINKRLTPEDALSHPWLHQKKTTKNITVDDLQDKSKKFKAQNILDMGKSTDVLTMLHHTYVGKKKKSSGNNLNSNLTNATISQQQNYNNNSALNNSIRNSINLQKKPSSNNYVPMTVSQIQMMKDDDIHIIKQKPPGYYAQFDSNNSSTIQQSQDFSQNNSFKNSQIQDLNLKKCLSKEQQINIEDLAITDEKTKKISMDEELMITTSMRPPSRSILYPDGAPMAGLSPEQIHSKNSTEIIDNTTNFNNIILSNNNSTEQKDNINSNNSSTQDNNNTINLQIQTKGKSQTITNSNNNSQNLNRNSEEFTEEQDQQKQNQAALKNNFLSEENNNSNNNKMKQEGKQLTISNGFLTRTKSFNQQKDIIHEENEDVQTSPSTVRNMNDDKLFFQQDNIRQQTSSSQQDEQQTPCFLTGKNPLLQECDSTTKKENNNNNNQNDDDLFSLAPPLLQAQSNLDKVNGTKIQQLNRDNKLNSTPSLNN